jgi:hypothetical protein
VIAPFLAYLGLACLILAIGMMWRGTIDRRYRVAGRGVAFLAMLLFVVSYLLQ